MRARCREEKTFPAFSGLRWRGSSGARSGAVWRGYAGLLAESEHCLDEALAASMGHEGLKRHLIVLILQADVNTQSPYLQHQSVCP